jgi:hypothetical protein
MDAYLDGMKVPLTTNVSTYTNEEVEYYKLVSKPKRVWRTGAL